MAAGSPGPVRSFVDRVQAGRVLGEHVARRLGGPGALAPVVVAVPRGGVPVGAGVAHLLGACLMVMPVGKVGAPGHEELAVGAVAPGGVTVLNQGVIAALRLSADRVHELVQRAAEKVLRQDEAYQAGRPPPPSLEGRCAVVVDDGLATGASMKAALTAVRRQGPGRVVLAVPVAPPEVLAGLAPWVDEEVCPVQPPHMEAVGAWYEDFSQTTDEEVLSYLAGTT
ncbi:MAG: phosphoribosyltransferase [Acidimicrobiales bacterium]